MKKLLLILTILISIKSWGQTLFPVNQSIGNATTNNLLYTINGGVKPTVGLILPTYTDTTAANTNLYIKWYDGAMIKTTTPIVAIWYRHLAIQKWIQILPAGGGTGDIGWLTAGNTWANDVDDLTFGTLSGNSILFKTRALTRLILDSTGILAESGTTVGLGYDPSNGNRLTQFSGGGGAVPISSLTAATGTNDINNANYLQQWRWNSFDADGNNALQLSANTTATVSGNSGLLEVSVQGANAASGVTSVGAGFLNSHTGTSSTNIAGYFSATGGSNNYAIIVPASSGSVGIGNSAPTSLLSLGTAGSQIGTLSMAGNTSGTITIQPQAAAGTYNFNLPTTAGTSGYLLTSAGGGGSPMTWTDPAAYTAVPTWQQTLTAGSTLTGTNTIDGSAGSLYIENFEDIHIDVSGSAGGNVAEIVVTNPSTDRQSNINVWADSIELRPSVGHLDIDSLTNDVGVYALRWNPTTGLVSYADTTTGGGSGANTALSNLASVAINTSLLPGVSDNIDLGSTTFQWRNLYLGEGQKIDWDNGDATLTQVGNNVTLDGAAFLVTNAEQTPASFSSSFAGNMQVNWNSTTGNNVNFVFQDAGTARWYIGNNSATGSDRLHILNASAAEAVTVLQGLQVGINQTAPTARLHIGAGASTASYAPLKFTTGTNNTTAEAGAMEYTTPQLFFTNGRLVRQEIFQGQQARVSTQYDNTTTTLGNVTGLTVNVAASGTYRFTAKLFTTSDVAGGIKVAVGGTATATSIRYEGLTTDAGLTTQGRATALGTAVGAVTSVTAAFVTIEGLIVVSNAGTLTIQAAANAATGTTSVLTGSVFIVTEML